MSAAPAAAAPRAARGGLQPRQLRELVVRPALIDIGLWSQAAEDLVMGTAAQESQLRYLHQLGTGPALGLWQMEPATHNDIWDSFITYRRELRRRLLAACQLREPATMPDRPAATTMIWNLRYAACMCRLHYYRRPDPIPGAIEGQAAYWKRAYNTAAGAGTAAEYIKNYAIVA